ncbi:MAG: glycosyltransferase [Gemmatimonadaceae bacterium]|nr:glycosyltransferase [Gemmatimonadaceae bacterium]
MAALIAAVCSAAYLLLLALKGAGVWISIRESRQRARRAAPPPADWMQSVCVLQPILSGDPRLPEVLADTVTALPHVQFLWLVDRNDLVAGRIVSAIRRAHPSVAIDVQHFDAAPPGVNPKLYKLAPALDTVARPIAVVLDDDARLSPRSLQQMVTELDDADLVTALPFYRDHGRDLGAGVLAQFVNNNSALTYLSLLPVMAPVSINGMCYAARTVQVSGADSLAPVVRCLADDLAVAQLFRGRGRRIVQSTAPVALETSTPTFGRYWRQMHRWFVFAWLLLRDQGRAVQLLIVILHAAPPALLLVMLVATVLAGSPLPWVLTGIVVLLRAFVVIGIQRALTARHRHRVVLSLVSELLQPLHLMHALLDRTITWRTRTYHVRANRDFSAV